MISYLRRVLSFGLSVVMLAVTPAPVIANTHVQTPQYFTPDFNLPGLQRREPMLKEFAEATWAPPKFGPFDAQDPVLDEDPYFMRTQSYVAPFGHATNESVAVQLEKKSILIHLPGSARALRIDQALAPVGEIEHFLFMQARDKDLFSAKAANQDAYGEGLFFIDKRDLQLEINKSADRRPIPIMFLPLPGLGWTEKIDALVIEPVAIPAFRNATGETATIDLQDIYKYSRIEHSVLTLAMVMALKNDVAAQQFMQANMAGATPDPTLLPFVLPPRGSTAAFGSFFTGTNLDHPEQGVSELSNRHTLNLDLLPSAHSSIIPPDLLSRLLIVAGISLSTYLVSIGMQYSILRERMLERRNFIETNEDALAMVRGNSAVDRTGLWFQAKRELGESVDVFTHTLAAISSGPGVSGGFLLEYSADKSGKPIATAPNGLIRRFLEYTFLYYRKQNENVGTNWMCFILGVLILGGVDTVGVVAQLMAVSPIVMPWVSQILGPEKHAEVTAQFAGDTVNDNAIYAEIMRNLTSYFISGSYAYSSDQRQTLMEIVRPDVERQIKAEGKDPLDPNNQKEITKRIEDRLEIMLVERGLPSRREFLYSGPSVFRSLYGLLGYKVDRKQLETSADYQADKQKRIDAGKYQEGEKVETFMLERARYGLVSRSLKVAMQSLLDLAKDQQGDSHLTSAIQILGDTTADFHALRTAFRHPSQFPEAAKRAYRARKALALFSYEGDLVGGGVKYLDLWEHGKADPAAATIAARAYRQAFFGTVHGQPGIVQPEFSDIEKYGAEARAEAQTAMAATDPKVGFDETDLQIATLENVKLKVQEETEKAEVAKWKPEPVGIYENMQRERAHQEALVSVHNQFSGSAYENPALEVALARGELGEAVQIARSSVREEIEDLITRDNRANDAYRIAYRDALARIVSLYTRPDAESELVRLADESANAEIEKNVTRNPIWQRHIGTLEPLERVRFLSHAYADTFLNRYSQLTVSNSSVVSLTSPEQPGYFQRLRQKALPNKNTFVGRMVKTILRIAESPMDATAHRSGFSNFLRRNIPWYQDTKTHAQLKWRGMWVSLSAVWAAQYFVWQVKFPWPTAVFFFWTALFVNIAHSWMDRIMMNSGAPPMKTAKAKFVYSNVWTWLSYPTYFPFFFYFKDFNRLFDRFITTPLASAGNEVVHGCAALLNSVF